MNMNSLCALLIVFISAGSVHSQATQAVDCSAFEKDKATCKKQLDICFHNPRQKCVAVADFECNWVKQKDDCIHPTLHGTCNWEKVGYRSFKCKQAANESPVTESPTVAEATPTVDTKSPTHSPTKTPTHSPTLSDEAESFAPTVADATDSPTVAEATPEPSFATVTLNPQTETNTDPTATPTVEVTPDPTADPTAAVDPTETTSTPTQAETPIPTPGPSVSTTPEPTPSEPSETPKPTVGGSKPETKPTETGPGKPKTSPPPQEPGTTSSPTIAVDPIVAKCSAKANKKQCKADGDCWFVSDLKECIVMTDLDCNTLKKQSDCTFRTLKSKCVYETGKKKGGAKRGCYNRYGPNPTPQPAKPEPTGPTMPPTPKPTNPPTDFSCGLVNDKLTCKKKTGDKCFWIQKKCHQPTPDLCKFVSKRDCGAKALKGICKYTGGCKGVVPKEPTAQPVQVPTASQAPTISMAPTTLAPTMNDCMINSSNSRKCKSIRSCYFTKGECNLVADIECASLKKKFDCRHKNIAAKCIWTGRSCKDRPVQ